MIAPPPPTTPDSQRLPAWLQAPLARVVRLVLTRFPDSILEVRLFGSQARGDANSDSDVDLASFTPPDVGHQAAATVSRSARDAWAPAPGRPLSWLLVTPDRFHAYQATCCLLCRHLRV